MAKKATTRKKTATARPAQKKTAAATKSSKKDAAAFVDHIHTNKDMRAVLKKGWDEVVRAGKQKGYNFTRQELHDHLKKRYKVTSLQEKDEPDTCICI
jgi:predicted ribosomally synthesized peptide with nif11-like leader